MALSEEEVSRLSNRQDRFEAAALAVKVQFEATKPSVLLYLLQPVRNHPQTQLRRDTV